MASLTHSLKPWQGVIPLLLGISIVFHHSGAVSLQSKRTMIQYRRQNLPFFVRQSGYSRESCCSLSVEKLDTMAAAGIEESCPSTFYHPNLRNKCGKCTAGTCRLNQECVCPGDFKASKAWKKQCEYSFGKKWPDSQGEEDVNIRSCLDDAPKPERSIVSCCALTESQLMDMRGTNSNCPNWYYYIRPTSKCHSCPPGTCRVHTLCRCPRNFLEEGTWKRSCKLSFGREWPGSSEGREDIDKRSCTSNPPLFSNSSMSCCSLTEEKLVAMRGTSMDCPNLSYSKELDHECDSCPPGTCRLNGKCVCPGDFMNSLFEKCRSSFNAAWPSSIPNEDELVARCGKRSEPVLMSPTVSSSTPPDPSSSPSSNSSAAPESMAASNTAVPATSTEDDVGQQGPTQGPATSSAAGKASPASGDVRSTPKVPPGSTQSDEKGGLGVAEIAGIATGVLGLIAAVLGVCQYRRVQRKV